MFGTCAMRLGRLTEAKRYFTKRLKLASLGEQAHAAAVTLDHLALIEKQLGHYTEALRLSLQSLAEHRRLGDSAGEALCRNNLGSLHLVMRENEGAAVHLREGLAICERDGLLGTQAFILTNLTETAMRAGDLRRGRSLRDSRGRSGQHDRKPVRSRRGQRSRLHGWPCGEATWMSRARCWLRDWAQSSQLACRL